MQQRNIHGWNENQIRHLERWITESLPDAHGVEVDRIELQDDGSWYVHYLFEKSNGNGMQAGDWFTGRKTENGFEDFQLM